jgi:hypothetical protein
MTTSARSAIRMWRGWECPEIRITYRQCRYTGVWHCHKGYSGFSGDDKVCNLISGISPTDSLTHQSVHQSLRIAYGDTEASKHLAPPRPLVRDVGGWKVEGMPSLIRYKAWLVENIRYGNVLGVMRDRCICFARLFSGRRFPSPKATLDALGDWLAHYREVPDAPH